MNQALYHLITNSEESDAIASLAKHVRGLTACGLGEFKLHTLDGKTFQVLKDGSPQIRGDFKTIAQAVGFTV